jgi:hypothetical protein
MNNARNSGHQASLRWAAALGISLARWMRARFLDLVIAGEVLHDVQWAAPWRDCQSSSASNRDIH